MRNLEKLKKGFKEVLDQCGIDISMKRYDSLAKTKKLPSSNTIIRNLGGSWMQAKVMTMGKQVGGTVKDQVKMDKELIASQVSSSFVNEKYKKLLKERVFQDRIIDMIKEGVSALPTVTIPKKVTTPKGITIEEALLLFSDAHIGEFVSKEETGGFGEYNFDMFVARLELLFEKIIELIVGKMQGYQVNKLNIAMLGDIVSGMIHAELVETASDSVIEWTLGGALIISQFLIDLSRHFNEIEVTGIVGNHGRMTKDVRFKQRYVNWDYLLYQVTALMCRNQSNIKFDIPKSFFTLKEIAGQNYLLLHGDNIRMYKSIPWYGIERAVNELSQLLASQNRIFQHVLLAHFHNQGILDKVIGEIILNGSVIGGNEFSIGALFKSSDPKQMLMGVNSTYGPTWRFPINLREAKIKENPRYKYDAVEPLHEQVKDIL